MSTPEFPPPIFLGETDDGYPLYRRGPTVVRGTYGSTLGLDAHMISAIERAVREDVQARKDSSARGGGRDDDGASRDLDMLAAWLDGLHMRVPAQLNRIYKRFVRAQDPEFKEYQRLKARFENQD